MRLSTRHVLYLDDSISISDAPKPTQTYSQRKGRQCLDMTFCLKQGDVYRLATAGPVVKAPRASPRRLGVRLSSMQ